MSATAAPTTVYKWVDEKGVTHYSDQPHPNATTVDVRPAQTVSSAPVPSVSSPNTAVSDEEPAYTTCELYRPENDEVFLNTSTVTAKLRLEPKLAPGDQVGIAIDGKRQANQPRTGTEFVLTGVERGTHSVFAVVANAQGKPLCTTAPVTFHVRQPSVQAPVKAVRPKF